MEGALCHGLGIGVRKCMGWLIWFFCGLLGVIRGRFLSMISSTVHPIWPPSRCITIQCTRSNSFSIGFSLRHGQDHAVPVFHQSRSNNYHPSPQEKSNALWACPMVSVTSLIVYSALNIRGWPHRREPYEKWHLYTCGGWTVMQSSTVQVFRIPTKILVTIRWTSICPTYAVTV
jgi:hypothetical protein